MRWRSLIVALLVAVLTAASPTSPVLAQAEQGIAAIVNDEIISLHDLDSRMALFFATSNLQDTPETRRRMAPEVLRTLIDETLKRQEIRRQNLTVSQEDLDRALAQVATQLKVPPSQLPQTLAAHGVTMPTLIDQLESELGWYKLINHAAGVRGTITDEEVEEEIERSRHTAGEVEYHLAEIFLAAEDSADQAKAEELAQRLANEIRNGANFATLAHTFSKGPSAQNGGDVGWVTRSDLDPAILSVLSNMQPGEVANPIRTQGGYFILYLVDRRTNSEKGGSRIVVSLQQLFLPLPRDAQPDQVDAAAKRVSQLSSDVKSCADLQTRHVQLGSPGSGSLNNVDIQQLPLEFRQLVQSLRPGTLSPPIRTPDGMLVIMLCDRHEAEFTQEQRAQVERRIRDQRLASTSQRELRELRRAATIDLRL